MYTVIDEASEATCAYIDDYNEAIDYALSLPSQGKYLVIDDNDSVVFDTNPEVTFKI